MIHFSSSKCSYEILIFTDVLFTSCRRLLPFQISPKGQQAYYYNWGFLE